MVNDSIADIEFSSDANAVHEFTVPDEKIAHIICGKNISQMADACFKRCLYKPS